ncbi:cupredoxin family copper-binding protein [uncultured Ruegeria sp.]|uniref:cupredoxin domain-containing protein n=1 Tax=uncultured Ruegeria sp. TaxID=259304 RepID=UPI0026229837|nr:cupredoxin family copper-binding protein [uncultured Ruegeria sp.]
MRQLMYVLNRRSFGVLLAAQLGLIGTGGMAGSAKTHVVRIKRFKFEPPELEIRPGDTVEWVNEDAAPHTATSVDKSWDTGALKKNQKASVTFDQVGTRDYFCIYHPHMKASLRVVA